MGTLEQIGDDLWVADGPVVRDLVVIPYSTRMTIVRLKDGGLWIASPVPSSFAGLAEVVGLGQCGTWSRRRPDTTGDWRAGTRSSRTLHCGRAASLL